MFREAQNGPRSRAPIAERGSFLASEMRSVSALLDGVGPTTRKRVLTLGEDTLEVLCALIRRGCTEAAELRLDDRPEAQSAHVVLVPHITSVNEARRAIAQAKRALVTHGRIIIRVASNPPSQVALDSACLLRNEGFSMVRMRALPQQVFLSAEWLLPGPSVRT